MQVIVKYQDRNGEGEVQSEIVEVRESIIGKFYAMGKWGCGKDANSISGAVRMLVQDMAIIRSIEQV